MVFPEKVKEEIKNINFKNKETRKIPMLIPISTLIYIFFLYYIYYIDVPITEVRATIRDGYAVIGTIVYTLIILLLYIFMKSELPDIDRILMHIFKLGEKDDEKKFHLMTRESNVPYIFDYNVSLAEDYWSRRRHRFGSCFIFGTITFENYELFITEEQLEKIREKYYFINISMEKEDDRVILHLRNGYEYEKIIKKVSRYGC